MVNGGDGMIKRILLVVFFLTYSLPAFSSGFVQMSLDQVYKKSDFAFEGTCVESKSFAEDIEGYKRPIPVTEYKFKITKWIKKPEMKAMNAKLEGDKPDSEYITFKQRGVPIQRAASFGSQGRTPYITYDDNKQYILLMRNQKYNFVVPVGSVMGKQDVVEDANGNKVVKNFYMNSLIKSSPSVSKSLSAGVNQKTKSMDYDSFMKAVEGASK